jgi:hypothetical protein
MLKKIGERVFHTALTVKLERCDKTLIYLGIAINYHSEIILDSVRTTSDTLLNDEEKAGVENLLKNKLPMLINAWRALQQITPDELKFILA